MPRTIVVAGALAQRPHYAGHTWQFLQYVLGLKDLGWDVVFLDCLEPAMCVDADGKSTTLEKSVAWSYFHRVMQQFGLQDCFSLIHNGREFYGLDKETVLRRTKESAFLLNVMGFLTHEEILAAAPRRVFLDTDPGIGQFWCELGLDDVFAGHDDFVTIGENIGQPGCTIPTCGRKWITMRQPVVLSLWPTKLDLSAAPITSIVSWRGPFGPLEYQGKKYGLRVHEFRKFVRLPTLIDEDFHLALDIDPVEVRDILLLRENGWSLKDPKVVAAEPLEYQKFIHHSCAEFMVAKNIYVETRGGWFSDRSTCYLASGKPVLAQDTGLSDIYPTGEGLIVFSTLEEARAGLEAIRANYFHHARAARWIAESYFDSRKVFRRLLSELGVD